MEVVHSTASLECLRDFALGSFSSVQDKMSAEEFDEFLTELGLLWKSRKCPSCHLPCRVFRQAGKCGHRIRAKFICRRKQCREPGQPRNVGYLKGTFFEKLKCSRKKLFLASALFVDDTEKVENRAQRCTVSQPTIMQWDQWFRGVIVGSFFNDESPHKIGGPNTILQLEEAYIAEQERGEGRLPRDCWVVMGTIEDSKEIFVQISPKRVPATLDSIIAKHVLPGTTIGNLGYVHKVANCQESSPIPLLIFTHQNLKLHGLVSGEHWTRMD